MQSRTIQSILLESKEIRLLSARTSMYMEKVVFKNVRNWRGDEK